MRLSRPSRSAVLRGHVIAGGNSETETPASPFRASIAPSSSLPVFCLAAARRAAHAGSTGPRVHGSTATGPRPRVHGPTAAPSERYRPTRSHEMAISGSPSASSSPQSAALFAPRALAMRPSARGTAGEPVGGRALSSGAPARGCSRTTKPAHSPACTGLHALGRGAHLRAPI